MSILQQSSKAQDRSLGTWFVQITAGTLKLPRFQRFEAWDRWRVAGFLNTVIQNLPVGVTLLLQVGDKERFISRYIATAPETSARVTEHLLDGQQRLTAFWRAMHNNYDDETYYVYVPELDQHKDDAIEYDGLTIHCQPRWKNRRQPNARYPVWADSPARCLERGLIPVDLLCPGDHGQTIDSWIIGATKEFEPDETAANALAEYRALEKRRLEVRHRILSLRELVTHFNLPFLALPVDTNPDVALKVFVNMNTNSKPLSMYDLTVAKVESSAGESLHALQERSESLHTELSHFGDMSWTFLATSALMQGRMPNKTGVASLDMHQLVNRWPETERALVRGVGFLKRQQIHDEMRLPSAPVLAVISACLAKLPEDGDVLGRAETLLRAYMWSSFFTNRYEGAAATRSYQDYKTLAGLLERTTFSADEFSQVPVMNRVDYPLPTVEQLVRVGWPRGSDRLARAVLAVNLHFGGLDFADGMPASYESMRNREYHHVFPDALLTDAGIDSFLALNCALVTWKTNRNIGRKDPLEYLKDRVEWSDVPTIKHRLRTHLLDYELLAAASYSRDGKPLEGEGLRQVLEPDFRRFLERRAIQVEVAANHLCNGRHISLDALLAESHAKAGD